MVTARSPSFTVLPMSDGSLSSAVLQKRCVSTAAGAACGPSSVASSRRPTTGRSPITLKYEPPTTPARTTRGSPRPTSVKSTVEKSPKAETVVTRERRSRSSGTEKLAFSLPLPVRALPDVDQPILVIVDERAQQHAPHDAEDGGVGADAERQRQDDGDRQSFDAPE